MKKFNIIDPLLNDLLCMYCDGRPFWWRTFFGQRKIQWNKNGVFVSADFIVSEKTFQTAKDIFDSYS